MHFTHSSWVICILLTCLHLFIVSSEARIYGFTVYQESNRLDGDIVVIPSNRDVKLRLFGEDLYDIAKISFSPFQPNVSSGEPPPECENTISQTFPVSVALEDTLWSIINIRQLLPGEDMFYLCAQRNLTRRWEYQGFQSGGPLALKSEYRSATMLPIWLQVLCIILLFLMSGLFSGLNLGLMSLNVNELRIVEIAGSEEEKRYAKKIRPVRRHGNYLLCTLVLGNVLVNTTLTLLMDDLTGSGVYAVIFSTIGITLFGEIIPQAVCSRYGMAVGAHTVLITKLFMGITAPLSYPISWVLDRILGEEIGQRYSREKLRLLIEEQTKSGQIVNDELNIITGALSLTTKTVKDVMTKLHDAYMIDCNAVLDFDTLNEIVRNGYTRIPVFDGERSNITAVLNVKDLALIDPEARTPVATVCSFYQRSILIADENESLEKMLRIFRTGKTHMAFAEHIVREGDGDPYREMVGLITLEDVIEEIIQAEIVDETDTVTDKTKRRRRQVSNQDFSVFLKKSQNEHSRLSPQLKMAVLRHLACNVECFNEDHIDKLTLQNLLNTEIVVDQKLKKSASKNTLYEKDKAVNYVILIVQGHVQVEVTSEGLVFEAGPFILFGESMLKALNAQLSKLAAQEWMNLSVAETPSFKPDYTVRISSDVQYLRITSRQYLFVRRQSAMLSLRHAAVGAAGENGGEECENENNVCHRQHGDSQSREEAEGKYRTSHCTMENDADEFHLAWQEQGMDERRVTTPVDPNQVDVKEALINSLETVERPNTNLHV